MQFKRCVNFKFNTHIIVYYTPFIRERIRCRNKIIPRNPLPEIFFSVFGSCLLYGHLPDGTCLCLGGSVFELCSSVLFVLCV